MAVMAVLHAILKTPFIGGSDIEKTITTSVSKTANYQAS